MPDSPWSIKEIKINLVLMLLLIIYASIIIIMISWINLIIYWIFWALYLIIGRYVTCRHCDFLGKACNSWCVGIIGGKLYKRSDKACFPDAGIWKMFFFDVSFILIAVLYPFFVYGFILLGFGFNLFYILLISIYAFLAGAVLITHDKGCKKCPIEKCPLSKTYNHADNANRGD